MLREEPRESPRRRLGTFQKRTASDLFWCQKVKELSWVNHADVCSDKHQQGHGKHLKLFNLTGVPESDK